MIFSWLTRWLRLYFRPPTRKFFQKNNWITWWTGCTLPKIIRKQNGRRKVYVYFIAYEGDEPCGYVSVQSTGRECIPSAENLCPPPFSKAHTAVVFLFREAVRYIKEVHPEPCLMELNVNRNNKALLFYERMGMRKLREGVFPIGNGYYMNDYIMGLDI